MYGAPPIARPKNAASNGRASGCGAHSVEGGPVQGHELLHGHRPLTGNCGDDLVFAREDAVLVVEGDGAEMLDHKLRQSGLLLTLAILRDGQWPVGDHSAQHFADGGGDAGLIQLDRAVKSVGLAQMSGRLSEDGCNEPSLVLRRDRSVASLAIR